ncbi:SigE family RNA polymerase sigma factor [Actinoplanes awajinensis]|uniref:RNA polymerase subunit sigma n=1 Tax=Actinoplanes awajinensis subsp. mycoplanecinus TaxID=135947 RepID=A0A124G733_9ACTN|nr:SigE family RNA polymerase sigma factor [Actinoplanes awajinensis]KUL21490.1 RNA polymerase subunit sigma [Actinoplanes awajinensis subsp. mycoplanecinus]
MAEADGFREFVRGRSAALSRHAYLLTGDHHLGEDLLQSALASTYRHWRRVRDGDPEAYVRRAMYHQHVSWWRRRRVPEQLTGGHRETAQADPAEATVLRLTMTQALSRLSPKQRAVIVLRFYDDLTEAQAAQLLGCRVGTVKRHAHDALRRLRDIAPELLHETERSTR